MSIVIVGGNERMQDYEVKEDMAYAAQYINRLCNPDHFISGEK